MTLQTLIDISDDNICAVLVEDGEALEVHFLQKGGSESGALYLARVKKVESKLNAAFLDLGDFDAFLPFRHARALKDAGPGKRISDLVREGETLLVKIIAGADEDDGKLPLATANPMVAGRYALSGHLPGKAMLSQKISDPGKRAALSALLDDIADGNALVLRTNAAAVPEEMVMDEVRDLQALWKIIMPEDGKVGMVLSGLDRIEKVLRDFAPHSVDEILINDRVACLKAKKLVDHKWPDLEGKVKLYDEDTSIMEAFGVAERIDAAATGIIPLPSGGTLVMEETRAMTVIDVNSGTMQRGTSPEGVYLETNLEAAKAIARELRFQNISGLITVDFIDLPGKAAQEKVLEALDQALTSDPLPVDRTGFNRFGLLSLRRKRRGKALKAMLERV